MEQAPKAEPSDEQLLGEFCASRSAEAFRQIVERHLPMVQSVAARTLGDRHEAEDVAQAVFVILARKAPTLRKPGSLGVWLFRTAEFTARRARRNLALRLSREKEASVASALVEKKEEPVPAEWPELRGRLDQAIAGLPAASQRAVVLHYLEGRPRSEVAGVLGCSAEALAMRLSRALESLRRRLAGPGAALSVAGLSSGLAFEAAWARAAAVGGAADVAVKALAVAAGTGTGVAAGLVQVIAADALRAMAAAKLAKMTCALAAAAALLLTPVLAVRGWTESSAEAAGLGGSAAVAVAAREGSLYAEWLGSRLLPDEAGLAEAEGDAAAWPRSDEVSIHPAPGGDRAVEVVCRAEGLVVRLCDGSGQPRGLPTNIVAAGDSPVNWLPGGRFALAGSSATGEMLIEVRDREGRLERVLRIPEAGAEIRIYGDGRLGALPPVLVDPDGRRAALVRSGAGAGRLGGSEVILVRLDAAGAADAVEVTGLSGSGRVADALWSSDGGRLLVVSLERAGGAVRLTAESIVPGRRAQTVLTREVRAPERWDARRDGPLPEACISPDATQVLVAWTAGPAGRVCGAELLPLDGSPSRQVPWRDGAAGGPAVPRLRWEVGAPVVSFAVARPDAGSSAALFRFDAVSGRAAELLRWPLGQGPDAGAVRMLAGGAVVFTAHGQLWMQSRQAAAVPVPLALLPDAGHAALGTSPDGGRLFVERWDHDAQGRPRLGGLKTFTAPCGGADARVAGAYWRIFRAGDGAGSVRGELAAFVREHAGRELAALAGEYLRERDAAERLGDVQPGADGGASRGTEVF